jgi:hypothetical protein
MNITAVESTTFASLGYDDPLGILQLEFRSSGAVYLYFGVPVAVYEALRTAPSKGVYFNTTIRGHYPYSQASQQAHQAGES